MGLPSQFRAPRVYPPESPNKQFLAHMCLDDWDVSMFRVFKVGAESLNGLGIVAVPFLFFINFDTDVVFSLISYALDLFALFTYCFRSEGFLYKSLKDFLRNTFRH